MNDYEKTIEVLQNRVRELEQLIQPVNGVAEPVVKWQPKGGEWWINESGAITSRVESIESMREFGIERQTQEQAERAAVEMRRFNRLLALRDELCGDDVIEQNTTAQKYVVYFNAVDMQWLVTFYHINFVTPFFTTEEHAQRACDMLNSGEVEL